MQFSAETTLNRCEWSTGGVATCCNSHIYKHYHQSAAQHGSTTSDNHAVWYGCTISTWQITTICLHSTL